MIYLERESLGGGQTGCTGMAQVLLVTDRVVSPAVAFRDLFLIFSFRVGASHDAGAFPEEVNKYK